jgi:uncharacterized membrane protein YoaT (DUF817 family)
VPLPLAQFWHEFLIFGVKQAWACLFALFAMTAIIFARTWIHFKCDAILRRMLLLLGFFLVATFIRLAENIGTFSAVWLYPHQLHHEWSPVGIEKLGSWFLLMIISFVLVTAVHKPKPLD